MDLPLVLGLLLSLFSLVGGFLWEGGHAGSLLMPSAALIVFGGTFGATTVSFSISELKSVPKLFKIALFPKEQEPALVIDLIVSLADEARREGLLYLENRLDDINDQFLRKGVQLVVDGTDPELVRSIMEVELYAIEERHHVGSSIFEAAGGYAPTMGIIGTVMGLVHVLGNMSDPNSLGPAIAVAFLATLYGVGSANVLYLPMAAKLTNLSKKETNLRLLMIEGIVSLQAGYNPILIRERLSAFLNPSIREAEKVKEED
ncbi:MAG: flagellar motor protein MotA [Peptococcaceae bacterium BICA1-7]|nr:MAG: flagellar motor protein MotA [Peptococcaceae bacterium BICA1-7]HBV96570.1 flagellar motor protein [Desulfotomaculum sp.]